MQTNHKETKTRRELTYKRGLNGEQVTASSLMSWNSGIFGTLTIKRSTLLQPLVRWKFAWCA